MWQHFTQNGRGYLVAIALTMVIATFRLAVAGLLGDVAPFLPFVLAVMLSGWYGGLWPGLLATIFSAFCGVLLFTAPHSALQIVQSADLAALLLFVCSGAAISGMCEAMHSARRQLSLRVLQEQQQKGSAEAWQTRYEAAVKASHSILYDSNRETGQVIYGGDCESILGYKAGDINGDISKWIALIHPDDRHNFLKELGRTNSDLSPYRADYRMVRADGQIIWMRDDGHFAMREGETSRIIGFVRNVTDQRRAEQERSRLEERLTRLMDHTPLAVVEWDANFSVTRWAGQSERLFGWDSQEVLGKRFDEFRFFCQEDLLRVEEALQQLSDSANNCVISRTPNYCKSGEIICCEWYSSVLHDQDGKTIAILSLVLDVTERERSIKALQESEARFRHLADAMPQVVWIADSGGSVSYYNSRVVQFSGALQEADNAWNWPAALHPDDLDETIKAWSAAVQSRTPYQCEHRIRMSDGSCRWHLSRALHFVGLQGEVQWFGTATDIHDLKESEFALQESREQFRAFMASSPALAWAKDEFGRYVFMNRAYEERFGVRLQDWLGKTDFDVRPEELARLYKRNDEKALQAAAPIEAVEESIEADGRRCVWWSFKFVYSDGIGRKFVGGIAYDVTEQKKAQSELTQLAAQLADADHRKDVFLATLAHELRNPLAPIRSGLQIMKLPEVDAGTIEKTRSMMERQIEQMTRLIDDLMDLSRINQGKIVLQKTRMPLADAVRNAVDTSQPLIDTQRHELLVDMPPEPIYLDGDLTRLSQVFANLLNNSAKYTDRGGRIRLAVERQGNDAVVSVTDNGVGIHAEMLAHVFDMFAQIDGSLAKSQGGLGIGLNIVKRLVEMHGGSIDAESGGPGMGSKFTVRLPLALCVTDEMSEDQATSEQAKPAARRILVVDDNKDGAFTLAMMLKLMGNDTQTAHDGLEALAVSEAFRPDVILMDIGMPKLDGYDACRRIREQPWADGVVLVALTGWGQEEDRQKSKDAGFNGHLVKPVDHAALMKLLASS